MQRSLIALGLCVAIGGAAWAGLREPTESSKPITVAEPRVSQETTRRPRIQRPTETEQPRLTPPEQWELQQTAPPKPKVAKKEYALLTVASEPWGTLYLGNEEIGPTPVADYPLAPGTYRLRIEQEGYRSKSEIIVVTGPNPIRRRYSLEPQGLP